MTIALINPVRLAAHGYANIIAHNLSDDIVALWTDSKLKNFLQFSGPNHLIKKHIVCEAFSKDDYLHLLEKERIRCIIPVDDDAFRVYDWLQAELNPQKCNDQSLLQVRASKYEYLKKLHEDGLISTEIHKVNSDTLKRFNKRMVLKPIDGAGNENVFFVENDNMVRHIMSSFSAVEFMLQDFLDGEEYCVELCTLGNYHKCTAISKYGRNFLVDGAVPWRYDNDLVCAQDSRAQIAKLYAIKVVESLGVKAGLTWTQIKISNSTLEPNLIEVNFRSQGNAHPIAIKNATGMMYAEELLKLHLASEERFRGGVLEYSKLGDFKKLCINNLVERYIEHVDLEPVKSLKSVISAFINTSLIPGLVKPSRSFKTVLGMMIVQNNDAHQFTSDMSVINSWQQTVEK